MSTLEINKMLTISIGHISDETDKRIMKGVGKNINAPLDLCIFPKGDYGYFIFIDEKFYKEYHSELNVPDDLDQCIRFAIDNDCAWLCLDCDGIEVNELPIYDW